MYIIISWKRNSVLVLLLLYLLSYPESEVQRFQKSMEVHWSG